MICKKPVDRLEKEYNTDRQTLTYVVSCHRAEQRIELNGDQLDGTKDFSFDGPAFDMRLLNE